MTDNRLRSRVRRWFGWFTRQEVRDIADSIAKATCAAHVAAVEAATRECLTPGEREHFRQRVRWHMSQAAARDRADGWGDDGTGRGEKSVSRAGC